MTTPLRIDGVDISHWQSGDLDFAAAKKAGVKWVYHKASEDADYLDPMYAKRREEAKKAGLPFGAYHFARPSKGDAREEARWFINHAKPVPGDLRPVLDLETLDDLSGEPLVTWADNFCAEVERLIGVVPIVYTPYELSKELEAKTLMWRPRYNNDNTPPKLPYDIWQFSNGKYGVPNEVAGLGHVDLNTMRDGLKVSAILIPKPVAPEPPKPPAAKPRRLRFAHCSLQFSDTPAQHTADIERLFARGYDVITGTEAGPGSGNTNAELVRCAKKYGYRLQVTSRYDTWAAVKGSLVAGDWDKGAEFALWRSSRTPGSKGRWGDRGVVWISWDMGDTYGEFAVGSVHYLTTKNAGTTYKAKSDKAYAKVIAEWAAEHGKGKALAFIGGDFNLKDRLNDVFKGHPLTTCWDDRKVYPDTGHGNIDAIARYDRDGRVRCVSARALNDKSVFLNTDHFLIEAVYEIKPL